MLQSADAGIWLSAITAANLQRRYVCLSFRCSGMV